MNYEEIKAAWDAQADEYNQWDTLSEIEKIEWAASNAAAMERAYRTMAVHRAVLEEREAIEALVPPGWKLVPDEPQQKK